MINYLSINNIHDDEASLKDNGGMALPEIIRKARKAKNLTQEELGLKLGVTKESVSQWETGKNHPDHERYPAIAHELGLDPAVFSGLELPYEPLPNEVTPAPNAPGRPEHGEWPRDLPVKGVAVGGDDGDFQLNGDTAYYVPRPPKYRGRTDVFAVIVQSSSMSPWREPGSYVYAEEFRPPKNGEYVIVEMKPERGGTAKTAIIKRLMGSTAHKIRLLQYEPRKEFEIDKSRVFRMYRVIEPDEFTGA